MFSQKLIAAARVAAKEMVRMNQQEGEFKFGRQGRLRILRSSENAHTLTSFREQDTQFFIAFPPTP